MTGKVAQVHKVSLTLGVHYFIIVTITALPVSCFCAAALLHLSLSDKKGEKSEEESG